MKSGNKVYVIVITAIVLCFAFFFSTKLWCPDDRTKQTDNYNQLITAGQWDIQIGNAKYDKSSKTISCLVYSKTTSEDPKDYSITCYNGKPSKDIKLKYELKQAQDDPNFAKLYVYDVPNDYYYVTVGITAKTDDYSSTASSYTSSNENNSEYKFESNTSEKKTDNNVTKYIEIDYRTAEKAASSTVES